MSCKTCSNRRTALAAAIVAALAAMPPGEEGEHEDGTPHVATNYPEMSEIMSLAIPGLHPGMSDDEAETRAMALINALPNDQAVWANNTMGWVSDWFAGCAMLLRKMIADRVRAGNDEGLTQDAIAAIRAGIVADDRRAELMEAFELGQVHIVGVASGPEIEEARDPRFVH